MCAGLNHANLLPYPVFIYMFVWLERINKYSYSYSYYYSLGIARLKYLGEIKFDQVEKDETIQLDMEVTWIHEKSTFKNPKTLALFYKKLKGRKEFVEKGIS
jgi:hypothetical protein